MACIDKASRDRCGSGLLTLVVEILTGTFLNVVGSEASVARMSAATSGDNSLWSCPALCRASTSWLPLSKKDGDGRDTPGHDDDRLISAAVARMSAAISETTRAHYLPGVAALTRATLAQVRRVGKAAGRERVRQRAHHSPCRHFDSKNGGHGADAPLPTLRTTPGSGLSIVVSIPKERTILRISISQFGPYQPSASVSTDTLNPVWRVHYSRTRTNHSLADR
jgi:hypothetical protein